MLGAIAAAVPNTKLPITTPAPARPYTTRRPTARSRSPMRRYSSAAASTASTENPRIDQAVGSTNIETHSTGINTAAVKIRWARLLRPGLAGGSLPGRSEVLASDMSSRSATRLGHRIGEHTVGDGLDRADGRAARAAVGVGDLLGGQAEPALALAVVAQGRPQLGLSEVGPHDRGEVQLGVGDLPQEEVRDPTLAAGADQQIERRQQAAGRQIAAEQLGVDRLGVDVAPGGGAAQIPRGRGDHLAAAVAQRQAQ